VYQGEFGPRPCVTLPMRQSPTWVVSGSALRSVADTTASQGPRGAGLAHRYIAHLFVLVLCIGLAGYTSTGRAIPAALRSMSAAGVTYEEGGEVGTLQLDQGATIVKPIDLPTAPDVPRDPIQYVVSEGDTVEMIASRYHLTADEIRWSNPSLGTTGEPSQGQQLWLPPVPGVVVVVKRGDTLRSLAAAFHVQPQVIVDFNQLPRTTLVPGQVLVLPGGHGLQLITDGESGSGASWPGQPDIRIGGPIGSSAGDPFPWGQCTWYVWTRIHVPWQGNAYTWYQSAIAHGWSVGSTPRLGAIMVSWESPVYGHVAVVDAVYPDGSWLVSEMNYIGVGVIDQRIVRPGQAPLIGFIYG
jgi:LysM repeat protein